jgi:predicted transcriptional regulator
MPERHEITELQLAILRLLWERGEATVAELWERLHEERGLAQTTVATLVARLQRRGIVARRTRDRQYVYRATITEADVQHSMVSELKERLFAGDTAALVSHLISAADMSPGDLARMKQLLEDAQASKRSKGEST